MKPRISHVLFGACALLLLSNAPVFADDCPGGWQVMPGYNPSMGAPCQRMGLNSRMGTCLPGHAYETLCDDASGGRYKTCQGSRPCQGGGGGGYGPPPGQGGYGPPPGYGGGYGPPQGPPCSNWDYKRNQPCPPGKFNPDCTGSCDGRY